MPKPPSVSEPTDASQARIVIERSGPERPWLGQLVRFDVQVWRPSLDAAPLPPFEFDELNMPGAIAHFREEAPPPDEKEEGEQSFLVQHRTLVVFPQRDGHLTLPSLVARWTEDGEAQIAESTALEFDAAVPPHADERLVVSPSLQIQQTTSQPLVGLKVGDGFVRTVTVSATDSDPLVLPAIEFPAVSGLSLYPRAAKDASSAERGQLSASRTFQVTYVVERVGHFELEAASLRWLDPRSGHFHEAAAPELAFWARPNLGLGFSMWGTTPWAGLAGFGLAGALLMLTAGLIYRRTRGGPFAFERTLRKLRAEKRAFSRLLTLADGPDLPFLSALYEWLRVRFPFRVERTLAPLRQADGEMASRLALIERSAFSSGAKPAAPADPSTAALLKRARRELAAQRDKMVFAPGRGLNEPREWKGKS